VTKKRTAARPDEPKPPAPPQPPAPPPADPKSPEAAAGAASGGRAQFVRHCAKCHGEDGRGKTKMGERMGAKDMTDPAWQAGRTDAAVRKHVRDGNPKQKHPAFGDDKLDDDALAAVIAHVRSLGR
jgi:mono/diheme cytochrome c family protein